MFSLHIDTARGWRGGQSQVLHTVLGLRAIGHRAALVAHPDGELLRRMSEGHDLIPLAPRGEVDLAAAWRLSRVIKQLAPDVIHAHDPHAVAMASTALSIVSPSPKPPLVASRRIASPHGAELVLALEVFADRLLHRQQRRHSRSAGGGGHSARQGRPS